MKKIHAYQCIIENGNGEVFKRSFVTDRARNVTADVLQPDETVIQVKEVPICIDLDKLRIALNDSGLTSLEAEAVQWAVAAVLEAKEPGIGPISKK